MILSVLGACSALRRERAWDALSLQPQDFIRTEEFMTSPATSLIPAALETESHPSSMCPVCGHGGGQRLLSAPDRFHGKTESYQLLRCPSCSLVWLKDPPPSEEMGRHYGEDYDRAIAAAGHDPAHWRERAETVCRFKAGGAVLDLGCSSGGFLASLKGPRWQLFGIEMSESVARVAEDRTGAHVFVGDILDAPFPPASFDAITCFHVFEHLYRPKEVLAKVANWLKPGGVFYTMMPNIDSAGARIFKSHWFALELPRHLHHFSPRSLKRLAHSVGLQEVSVTMHRELFVEASLRYILDDVLRGVGIRRTPLAYAKPASLPWKIVRKGIRLTVLPLITLFSIPIGEGESIHAIFSR